MHGIINVIIVLIVIFIYTMIKMMTLLNGPKTLNIGAGGDLIHVTHEMIFIELEKTSDLQSFDFEDMDNTIFYISNTNKYILYKNKDFRYVNVDKPLH